MGRHDYEYDIYGDIGGGNSLFVDEPPPRDDFKIMWPPGYWEEYDRLQAEARKVANDSRACLVVKLNGKFQVRSSGCIMQVWHELRYVHGPEMPDRLEAWAAFIDSLTTKPTQALKELAGKKLKINMSRASGSVNGPRRA